MPLIASDRVPAGSILVSGGRAARTASSMRRPSSPSSILRSIRLRRPGVRRTSCAPATSMSRTSARPVRASRSAGSSTPTTASCHSCPPMSTGSESPGPTRAKAAVAADTTTPRRVVKNAETSRPDAPPTTYGRNGPSENGSIPSTRSDRPGSNADWAKPSTIGAAARMPRSTRRSATYASSIHPSSRTTTCVARPATLSAEIRKAVRALWMARSIESTTATPSATPRIESSAWARCFER